MCLPSILIRVGSWREAEIDRWQKQVDEATNAINQLKTAQVNVDAGGTPPTPARSRIR